MKIPLTKGKFAIIDDADEKLISNYSWQAYYVGRKNSKRWYAGARERITNKMVYMHRLLSGVDGMLVDHINGDSLDNRRSNLRPCTNSQNNMNKGPTTTTTSKYRGVNFDKCRNKWKSRIKVGSRQIFIGRFQLEVEAALAYDKYAKQYFREFAKLNFGGMP